MGSHRHAVLALITACTVPVIGFGLGYSPSRDGPSVLSLLCVGSLGKVVIALITAFTAPVIGFDPGYSFSGEGPSVTSLPFLSRMHPFF